MTVSVAASSRSRTLFGQSRSVDLKVAVLQQRLDIERDWSIAAWFGVITYIAWSPIGIIQRHLPSGSIVRGLVLVSLPGLGVVLIQRHRNRPHRRIDVLAGVFALLALDELVGSIRAAGAAFGLHLATGVALLTLALSARPYVHGLSRGELRRAVGVLLRPMGVVLLANWVAQLASLVPVQFQAPDLSASSSFLSVHGLRLSGLESPNGLGLLAAMISILALIATPTGEAWFMRVFGIVTLIATDSRTATIACGVGALLLILYGPIKRPETRGLYLSAICLVGVVGWSYIDFNRYAGSSSSSSVLSGRRLIWHDLLPYLHHVPVFGYGPNFFPDLATHEALPGLYVAPNYIRGFQAQNQLLSDALVFGLAAAVMTLAALIVVGRQGSFGYRSTILWPILSIIVVECITETPISLYQSIEQAFPLYLLVLLTPVAALPRPAPRQHYGMQRFLDGRNPSRHN